MHGTGEMGLPRGGDGSFVDDVAGRRLRQAGGGVNGSEFGKSESSGSQISIPAVT